MKYIKFNKVCETPVDLEGFKNLLMKYILRESAKQVIANLLVRESKKRLGLAIVRFNEDCIRNGEKSFLSKEIVDSTGRVPTEKLGDIGRKVEESLLLMVSRQESGGENDVRSV